METVANHPQGRSAYDPDVVGAEKGGRRRAPAPTSGIFRLRAAIGPWGVALRRSHGLHMPNYDVAASTVRPPASIPAPPKNPVDLPTVIPYETVR